MAGNRQRIIVTEIPYQVNKATWLKAYQPCAVKGHRAYPTCATSPTARAYACHRLKRDVNANVVLNQLYKHTLAGYLRIIMLAC